MTTVTLQLDSARSGSKAAQASQASLHAQLTTAQQYLPAVLDSANADMVFYFAGVDVAAGDRYSKLALTEVGIGRRDRCVIEAAHVRGLPLTIVLAGGRAPSRARTAELHAHVFREGVAYEQGVSAFPEGATARSIG